VILFAAPGFYHGAETVQDLVDFVVARCLDQLGVPNELITRCGDGTSGLRPDVPGDPS
jgi:4-hydroxy-3-polyprenylbenzoate decarboxylase